MARTSDNGGPEWRALPPTKKQAAAQQNPPPRRAAQAHTTHTGGLDWSAPPPKKGRTEPLRAEEISKGQQIRKWIERDRRRRGIPREGTLFDGEKAEVKRKKTP